MKEGRGTANLRAKKNDENDRFDGSRDAMHQPTVPDFGHGHLNFSSPMDLSIEVVKAAMQALLNGCCRFAEFFLRMSSVVIGEPCRGLTSRGVLGRHLARGCAPV